MHCLIRACVAPESLSNANMFPAPSDQKLEYVCVKRSIPHQNHLVKHCNIYIFHLGFWHSVPPRRSMLSTQDIKHAAHQSGENLFHEILPLVRLNVHHRGTVKSGTRCCRSGFRNKSRNWQGNRVGKNNQVDIKFTEGSPFVQQRVRCHDRHRVTSSHSKSLIWGYPLPGRRSSPNGRIRPGIVQGSVITKSEPRTQRTRRPTGRFGICGTVDFSDRAGTEKGDQASSCLHCVEIILIRIRRSRGIATRSVMRKAHGLFGWSRV